MWLHQNGFPSVAILGATLSKTQEELLSKLPVGELVICLDNDEAGQKGKEKLMACMSQNFVVSYIKLPKGVKDIQDVKTETELKAIIEHRDIW
jgi:DNA primase